MNLKELLEKIGYVQHINGGLVNHKNYEFEFFQRDNNYVCYNDKGEILFVAPITLSLGTSLVLLQEFMIINERYIYETVDAIEEMFENNYNEDEE